ncbi:hypothetical protein [Pyxidicoccus trucidator]|uniref:hypothetical protein n=1 Tax=Pyxidicoccus trucidator TaxID=2709662 RepID=UPI0013D8EDA6|nr:hypothetical protein [Pyxidicoccus trucidator]
MSLPSDSEYLAAVQNPRQAFSDPELQDALPELMETGALAGMPRPRAGNFATVYKLCRGERAWAVRCFTRPIQPDQQARYQELIRHLAIHRLPYTVDVAFLTQGIQVQGRWFPIVKMEWVQGESLGQYVEKHRESPKALFDLAAAWVDLLGDLRRARMAHGDLQHGNVVITPGGLRLVDYDGMFVPALEGRWSHERGHANYQHPDRDGGFLHGRLDHFSAWVVWLSLVALAHEPSLWERFHGGDDCLLFRKKDFVEGERSPLLQALLGSRHEPVKVLASYFLRSVLPSQPAQVPLLSGADLSVLGREDAPERLAPPTAAGEVARFTFPVPSTSPVLTSVPLADRQMANGFLLAGGLSAVLSAAMSPAWLVGLGLSGGLGWVWARASFQRQELVARRRQLEADLARTRRELAEAEEGLRRLVAERARLEKETQARCTQLLASLDGLRRQRDQLFEQAREVREAHESSLARLTERRRELDAREHRKREVLSAEQSARMAKLVRQRDLASYPTAAIAEALRVLQAEHLSRALQRAELVMVRLDEVGSPRKLRALLRKAGLMTAEDVTWDSLMTVEGLDSEQRLALIRWRDDVARSARESMPQELPADQRKSLESTWATQQTQVEARMAAMREEFAHRSESLAARFAEQRESLEAWKDAEEEALRREEPVRTAEIDQEFEVLTRELKARTDSVDALDVELTAARRHCADLHWSQEAQAREQADLGSIDFSRYLSLLLKDTQGPA